MGWRWQSDTHDFVLTGEHGHGNPAGLETFRLADPAAGFDKALRRPHRRRPGTGPRRHRLQPGLSRIPGTRRRPRRAAVVRDNRNSGYEGYPRAFLASFRAYSWRPCFWRRAVAGIVKHPGHAVPSSCPTGRQGPSGMHGIGGGPGNCHQDSGPVRRLLLVILSKAMTPVQLTNGGSATTCSAGGGLPSLLPPMKLYDTFQPCR